MADSKGESIFDKIYYPELISISEPGRITSRGSDNYGKAFKKKRQVYLFERAFTDLQTSIMKKVGKKKAEEIFYRIGKDTGYRFMLLANMGKSRRYLVPIKLKLIFFMFRMFGFTLNEEILFDNKSMILKVRGKNNIFCSKTNEQGFSAGVVSGVYSVLVGKNIEAVKDSCSYDSDYCSVEANPKYKKRYIPKPKEIMPLPSYYKYNFGQKISASREYCSLQELISSGIMKVRNNNLMYLEKEQITINEIGALSLIFKTIDEYGLLRFSSETLKKSSKEITSELFRKNKELRKKIDILKKLTSAFGWGILKITYKEKQVKLFLEHFPYSRFRENCLIHLIIGMLENVFICRFKAVSSGFRFSSYSMTLEKI